MRYKYGGGRNDERFEAERQGGYGNWWAWMSFLRRDRDGCRVGGVLFMDRLPFSAKRCHSTLKK